MHELPNYDVSSAQHIGFHEQMLHKAREGDKTCQQEERRGAQPPLLPQPSAKRERDIRKRPKRNAQRGDHMQRVPGTAFHGYLLRLESAGLLPSGKDDRRAPSMPAEQPLGHEAARHVDWLPVGTVRPVAGTDVLPILIAGLA